MGVVDRHVFLMERVFENEVGVCLVHARKDGVGGGGLLARWRWVGGGRGGDGDEGRTGSSLEYVHGEVACGEGA